MDLLIALLGGVLGFAAGVLATAIALRRRRLARAAALQREPTPPALLPLADVSAPLPLAEPSSLTLLADALRGPLGRLRRVESCPVELREELERIAWQARMLVARSRPMQARPVAPIGLLQEAAEQVERLRLGKVSASWTLRSRQPVHVDPDRTRAAFRELLAAASRATGEGGRIGIRIAADPEPGYPVRVEIEIGRRGADPEPLPLLVGRRLLEAQGGRVEVDGPLVRVWLRSAPTDPPVRTEETARPARAGR
jgi:signal transduction histidine kinase